MTATILLIRHAAHSHLGRILSGRTSDVALSSQGAAQAAHLAQELANAPIDAIHTSPVQRAQETAQAVAQVRSGCEVQVIPALDEVDFGVWSGRTFDELKSDPRWTVWNQARAGAAAPDGESMAAAQARAWAHVEASALAAPGSTIAMVSHCDIIRAIVAHVLGLSLDRYDRFDVDPASCTRLAIGDWGAKVLTLNETFS